VAEFLENFYDECASDIIGMWRDNTLTETEREALIRARLRQGQFRTDLLGRWNSQCAVTGCSVEEVLRASHIKPWHCCDNQDRLNPENGLLLIANLDVLFDKFLITFADDGRMLVSDRIGEECYQQLGLPGALRQVPTPLQRRFLGYHREEGERRGISYR
jgi:predicted restriction endonuclease